MKHNLIVLILICTSLVLSQDRQWSLTLDNPLRDFESSAQAYVTLQQGLGYAVDRTISHWPHLREWPYRGAVLLVLAHWNLALGHYSHELGHDLWSPEFGSGRQGLDFSDWSYTWPLYYRERGYERCDWNCRDYDYWRFAMLTGGLNLEEYDAWLMAIHTHEELRWDEGMAYLFRRLSDLTYDLYGGGLVPRFENGFHMERIRWDGDVHRYLGLVRDLGTPINYTQYFWRAALADLLTWRVWESFVVGIQWITQGKESRQPLQFALGNWSWMPPFVSSYLMSGGAFWNISTLWNFGKGPWHRLDLGIDVDWIGDGSVDRLRLGMHNPLIHGKVGRIPVTLNLENALVLKRHSGEVIGHDVGLSTSAQFRSWLGWNFFMGHRRNDVIYQDIMHQEPGWYAKAGFQGLIPLPRSHSN